MNCNRPKINHENSFLVSSCNIFFSWLLFRQLQTVSLCLDTFLNELFVFSLTRCTVLSETGGLHRETPSSRYCVIRYLEVILMVHIT